MAIPNAPNALYDALYSYVSAEDDLRRNRESLSYHEKRLAEEEAEVLAHKNELAALGIDDAILASLLRGLPNAPDVGARILRNDGLKRRIARLLEAKEKTPTVGEQLEQGEP